MLVYQCDCFCDRCTDWQETGKTQHDNADGLANIAREVAKAFGWKRLRKEDGTYEDVCPRCLAKEPSNAGNNRHEPWASVRVD